MTLFYGNFMFGLVKKKILFLNVIFIAYSEEKRLQNVTNLTMACFTKIVENLFSIFNE
jgi:hypothetical protein